MWLDGDYYRGVQSFADLDITGAAQIYFTQEDRSILRQRAADGKIPEWLLDGYLTDERIDINLAIQSVAFDYAEISKIEEHLGDTASIHFYGRSPMILSVSAILMNDYANQSKHGLVGMYRHALRLTAVARSKAAPCLEFVGATAQGAFLDLAVSHTSNQEDVVTVAFKFLVFNVVWVNDDNSGSSKKVKEASIAFNTPARPEDLTIPPDYTVDVSDNSAVASTTQAETETAAVSTPKAEEAERMANNIPGQVDRDELAKQLAVHEGERLATYYDTEGYLTVGIGHNLDAKQTQGIIGRDIQPGETITAAESKKLFEYDLNKTIQEVHAKVPGFSTLSTARQHVILDMAFNMGTGGLLEFENMLAAIKAGDYDTAADEMIDSAWYGQVGNRSKRLVTMMRENKTFSEMTA